MDASTVAREGHAAVMAGKTLHVNGFVNRAIIAALALLPDGLSRALLRSRLQRGDR